MTDQIREQISAWLDGELRDDETGLLVRRLERDPSLRRTFGRYVLAGEVLRAPGGQLAGPGFAARVNAALGEESATEAARGPAQPVTRWSRPLLAGAVAAGAALVAVLLVRPDGPDGDLTGRTGAAPRQTTLATLAPAQRASPTPAHSQRLAGYLVAHSQFAGPLSRRNVWTGVLASDPGITRVAYEFPEAP
jgi:negative regulator of sigma E activity